MSSKVSGRLRVQRESGRLISAAARALDPAALAQWVKAGQAGALEAGRLLALSAEARALTLAKQFASRAPDDLLLGSERLIHDEFSRVINECGLSGALGDREFAVLVASIRSDATLSEISAEDVGRALESVSAGELVSSAHADLTKALNEKVASLVADDLTVIGAALKEALGLEAFVATPPRFLADGGLLISGADGDKTALIRVEANRECSIDMSVRGFDTSEECEARRDALREQIASFGLELAGPDAILQAYSAAEDLAVAVERAVSAALPGFSVSNTVEGDELQIVAAPKGLA